MLVSDADSECEDNIVGVGVDGLVMVLVSVCEGRRDALTVMSTVAVRRLMVNDGLPDSVVV